jgi:staphylococcal nuclease domain-containing protein 1
MFLGSDDVAVMLVREGLARVDDYSGSKELADAQEEAKRLGKNVRRLQSPVHCPADAISTQIWKDFDAAVQAAADSLQDNTQIAARREYVDCIVVDVRGGPEVPFSFAVQILTNGGAWSCPHPCD